MEADLTTWEPDGQFDLVVTTFAHPAMPQLAFYERIAEWVAPAARSCSSGICMTPIPQVPGTDMSPMPRVRSTRPPKRPSLWRA
jgi:hypothetical protein